MGPAVSVFHNALLFYKRTSISVVSLVLTQCFTPVFFKRLFIAGIEW